MLDTNIKNQLTSHFALLPALLSCLSPWMTAINQQNLNLANDLASLSDKFSARDNPNQDARRPSWYLHLLTTRKLHLRVCLWPRIHQLDPCTSSHRWSSK